MYYVLIEIGDQIMLFEIIIFLRMASLTPRLAVFFVKKIYSVANNVFNGEFLN
jgi:hypothetical protein